MIQRFRAFARLISEIRKREAAQRNFLRAIYEGPSRLPADIERPACLRRSSVIPSC